MELAADCVCTTTIRKTSSERRVRRRRRLSSAMTRRMGSTVLWLTVVILQLVLLQQSVQVQAVQTSKFQILVPPSLQKGGKLGYDHKDALFGVSPYGRSIQQQVYYSDADFCDASTIDPRGGYPTRSDGSPWKAPFILMIDRGDCSFVVKVRNAQKAGAAGVLIADDACLCDRIDSCLPKAGELCEAQEPLMADDGSGSDVTVPSFLLYKEDADEIKAALLSNQHVRAEMSFKVPSPNATVQYELWTAPPDAVSRGVEQTFGLAAAALGSRASFVPHPYVYDGVQSGCRSETGENQCFDLCLNQGRYCSVDPDGDVTSNSSSTGADVVREALRRLCIWQVHGTDGIGEAWWNYVAAFIDGCAVDDDYDMDWDESIPVQLKFNDPECVSFAMVIARVDEQAVNDCMAKSGTLSETANNTNTLLDQELDRQRQAGVVLIPSLVVNGAVVHGSLSFATVLRAVCSGFAPGSEPKICTSCANCHNELQCVESNGGICKSTVAPSITAAVVNGDVPMQVFATVLVGFAVVFLGLLVYQHYRQQRLMRDQVRGMVADYMPVTSQNTRSGDTSLALPQDDDDDDDNYNNERHDDENNNNNGHSSSFSIT